MNLMFVDTKKPRLDGKVREDQFEYVSLPREAGGGVERLKRWLRGSRPASGAWEEEHGGEVAERLRARTRCADGFREQDEGDAAGGVGTTSHF